MLKLTSHDLAAESQDAAKALNALLGGCDSSELISRACFSSVPTRWNVKSGAVRAMTPKPR